jgi:hypothetical protein
VTTPDPFRHLAVVHDDADDLVATITPLLDAAVTRGDLVWAAVDHPLREAVERHLGDRARQVVFGEPARPYTYSGQTTARGGPSGSASWATASARH